MLRAPRLAGGVCVRSCCGAGGALRAPAGAAPAATHSAALTRVVFGRPLAATTAAARHLHAQAAVRPAAPDDVEVHHPPAPVASVRPADNALLLHWGTAAGPSVFHSPWLYHNSPAFRDHSSGQKLLLPAAMAVPPRLESAVVVPSHRGSGGGPAVDVRFSDGSVHVFPVSWLAEHDYGDAALTTAAEAAEPPSPVSTRAGGKAAVPSFDYRALLRDEATVWAWLRAINEGGLTLVTGAPTDDGGVLTLASRVAAPMDTIYGRAWDVVSTDAATAINVAYTTKELAPHMDLAYYESPPGLQLLACRVFDDSVTGGQSTFLDAFALAEAFRQAHPGHFSTLCRVPATFQKIHYNRAVPAHIVARRPHFAVDRSVSAALRRANVASPTGAGARVGFHVPPAHTTGPNGEAVDAPPALASGGLLGALVLPDMGHAPSAAGGDEAAHAWHVTDLVAPLTGVFWAPQFEGPLAVPPEDVGPYYDAYGAWAGFLADAEAAGSRWLTEFRLAPGEVAVFNNRRMLHGRRAFGTRGAEGGGGGGGSGHPRRHLQGCYVNVDDYNSRLHALAARFGGSGGGGTRLRRVGNQQLL